VAFASLLRTKRALRRSAELARDEHLVWEIALCHGAIMTVAYPNPNARIVPARLVASAGRIDALAKQVASEQRLLKDWLQEDAVFGPHSVLSTADSGHGLVMKLHACERTHRPDAKDSADVEFLMQKIGLTSWAAVTSLYERFLAGCSLGGDVCARVAEMFLPGGGHQRTQQL
jgi:hypothetical protein